jgi:hypothetical protein
MSHPFPAYLRPGYLNATFITNNPFIAYLFIFATEAFEVFGGTKDSLAEKSVSFWLQGTVVNRLWLGYFAIGPASNLLW